MCWNAEVSLNTFLFSGFVLALIIYNNLFTKYKIQELNNTWIYLFIASFVFMQLIEFFIWRNINNKYYNHIFSISAAVLLTIQPIASLMIMTIQPLRNMLLLLYSFLAFPYLIYKLSTKRFYSSISKNGHLEWHFVEATPLVWIIWLFFFLFGFVYRYRKSWKTALFVIVTLLISIFNYKNDNTIGSMWCWIVNSVMIYYAAILLLYLPFREKIK